MADATKSKRLAPGYRLTPVWLKVSPELSSGQRDVYAELCGHIRDNPTGWPAISTLAQETSLSTSAVIRAIGVLEHHGLIRVSRSHGKVSHYSAPSHPWMSRDLAWAKARAKAKRKESAQRASARAEARQSEEPLSPWALAKRQQHVDRPVPAETPPSPEDTMSANNPTLDECRAIAREATAKRLAERKARPAPEAATAKTPVAPPAAPQSSRAEEIHMVEQAWRAAMRKHNPNVPLARGDWKATSGEGKDAVKLLALYSTEEVTRYVAWVCESWSALRRRHPKLSAVPTIHAASADWHWPEWMPQALGAVGADPIAHFLALNAEASRQMEETGSVFMSDDLSEKIARAHAAACAAGWRGKL